MKKTFFSFSFAETYSGHNPEARLWHVGLAAFPRGKLAPTEGTGLLNALRPKSSNKRKATSEGRGRRSRPVWDPAERHKPPPVVSRVHPPLFPAAGSFPGAGG